MLVRRLTTMLPAMTVVEAIETTRLPRVAGLMGEPTAVVTIRPCLAPDHGCRSAVMISFLPTSVLEFAEHCSGFYTL
jgi:magnesium chelatase family protein